MPISPKMSSISNVFIKRVFCEKNYNASGILFTWMIRRTGWCWRKNLMQSISGIKIVCILESWKQSPLSLRALIHCIVRRRRKRSNILIK